MSFDPAGRLPPELIIQIFRLGHDLGPSGVEFAFYISQVSSRWRSIALETPVLWAWISVDLKSRTHLEKFWRIMCERAREAPAVIVIRSVGEGHLSALGACNFQLIKRIKSISFIVTGTSYAKELHPNFIQQPRQGLGLLEFLVDSPDIPIQWWPGVLNRFPPSKSLAISGFDFHYRMVPHQHNVEHLRAYDLWISFLIPLISDLNSLKSLDVRPTSGTGVDMNTKLVLPSLTKMKIQEKGGLLQAFSCPNIRTLDIDYVSCAHVLAWIKRHSTIQKVQVAFVESESFLLGVALPRLSHLSITHLPADLSGLVIGLHLFFNLQIAELHDTDDRLTETFFDRIFGLLKAGGRDNREAATSASPSKMLKIYSHVGGRRHWRASELFQGEMWIHGVREGGNACVGPNSCPVVCEEDIISWVS